MTATDPMIAGCLRRVMLGDVSAVGVLADYLEETGQPPWKRLRKLWNTHQRNVAYWSNPDLDLSRRSFTRWEVIAGWRADLRAKVARLFGRRWRRLPLEKLA